MTDDEKREYAEAIKHALGMSYGPPMEGEEGWVPPDVLRAMARCMIGVDPELMAAVRDEHFHEAGDGRPPRRVLVDGVEIKNVVRCHETEGWAEYCPSKEEMRGVSYPGTRKIFGKVEVRMKDADDEPWDVLYGEAERTAKERAENAQAVIEAIREAKERRMAEELAKQRAKAAEPKPAPPSDDPWAVIGKAEDDGEWIMKKVRDFG